MQKACKHNSDGSKLTSICKWLPLYKLVHVATKNSKICDKVTVTIRGSYLLHADEHINKIEELSIYIQKSKESMKGQL